jgi:hypothetical protein
MGHAKDIFHILGEVHFNLGISLIQIYQFESEFLSKRLLFNLSKDRPFYLIVHDYFPPKEVESVPPHPRLLPPGERV